MYVRTYTHVMYVHTCSCSTSCKIPSELFLHSCKILSNLFCNPATSSLIESLIWFANSTTLLGLSYAK